MKLASMSCQPHLPRACVAAAATLCVCATVAATAAAGATPARDTFRGVIAKATGRLSADRNTVTVLLRVAQSTDAARRVALTLVSGACGSKRHCLTLSGTLNGTITVRPATIPDVGKRYDLVTSGRLKTLGKVSASGQVTGAGFIRQAREGMILTLRSALGTVTIHALSPPVPGFTSP